jgi:CRP/FNR family transcriptional regulator
MHGCSLCADIDEPVWQEISRNSRVRAFSPGDTVTGEAEDTIFVGFVISGVLRLQKTLSDGRQQIVGLLLPGDMFGRIFSRTSDVAIEAACETRLCQLNRATFEALLGKYPQLERRILRSQLERLDEAQNWMLLLGCQNVMERVATFLLLQLDRKGPEERHGAPGPSIIAVPVSRTDLAAYLGTTVESISRAVHELGRKGVLRIIDSRHFEILDSRRLARLSGRTEFEHDMEQNFRRELAA